MSGGGNRKNTTPEGIRSKYLTDQVQSRRVFGWEPENPWHGLLRKKVQTSQIRNLGKEIDWNVQAKTIDGRHETNVQKGLGEGPEGDGGGLHLRG